MTLTESELAELERLEKRSRVGGAMGETPGAMIDLATRLGEFVDAMRNALPALVAAARERDRLSTRCEKVFNQGFANYERAVRAERERDELRRQVDAIREAASPVDDWFYSPELRVPDMGMLDALLVAIASTQPQRAEEGEG